jgi:hypothetical protein
VQFTWWGADGANEGGKGIDKISSNIWQVLKRPPSGVFPRNLAALSQLEGDFPQVNPDGAVVIRVAFEAVGIAILNQRIKPIP